MPGSATVGVQHAAEYGIIRALTQTRQHTLVVTPEMTSQQTKHRATDAVTPPLLPALFGLGGAFALPPLVLWLVATVAVEIVRFSPLAIISAIDLFGSDYYGLIMVIVLTTVVILAEIGAFWGFLGGTFVYKLTRTATTQATDRA